MPEISKGQILSDRFELLALLGKGGMGDVWLAEDKSLSQKVALKILKPALANDPDSVALLQRECANARRLIHPNITRVFDFHDDGANRYVSMEYVEGDDLGVEAGQPLTQWIDKFLTVLDAIEYAHGVGLVHRDIKTSNVLCTPDGVVKLGDFGIGALLGSEAAGGSPYSASPQQLSGGDAAVTDDVYSLGVMLYELIDGKPPFFPNIDEDKSGHVVPPPPGTDYPLPEGLVALVMRMLAKTPDQRPSSASEVRYAIADITGAGSSATLPPGQSPYSVSSDTIKPIRPGQIATGPELPRRERKEHGPVVLIAVVAVLLLVTLVGVFVYLPDQIEKPVITRETVAPPEQNQAQVATATATSEKATVLAPYEQAQAEKDREEAEGLVAELLRKQFALEDRGVNAWAGEQFEKVTLMAQEGDTLFRNGQYSEALAEYRAALEIVNDLTGRADDVFAQALAEGAAAIENSDAGLATTNFELALAMEPGNATAVRGLKLAASLEQILGLMSSAEEAQAGGDTQAAKAAYEKVLSLNPAWQPARQALAAMNRDRASQNYTQAMSQGFAGLVSNDLDKARSSFERALQIRPGNADAQDGMLQVDEAIRLRDIEALGVTAQAKARDENWQAAADDFKAALKIDPNLVFARQGLTQAETMASVDQEFALYFDRPERLAAEGVYQGAFGFLEQVESINSPGPKLSQNIGKLKDQLRLARVPVKVEFLSDNETEVYMYQVGNLGAFTNRELELYPGEYTLVGTRSGYRDVRQQLKVLPGQIPAPVVVRCEERI